MARRAGFCDRKMVLYQSPPSMKEAPPFVRKGFFIEGLKTAPFNWKISWNGPLGWLWPRAALIAFETYIGAI